MGNNIDSLKKLFVTGLGAALMTEEGILKILSDIKLPGDAKNFILSQAQKRKEDVTRIIAGEVKLFLKKVNIHEELRKTLTGLKIDIVATIHVDKEGTRFRVTKKRSTRGKKELT